MEILSWWRDLNEEVEILLPVSFLEGQGGSADHLPCLGQAPVGVAADRTTNTVYVATA